jgi:hypothetical protein
VSILLRQIYQRGRGTAPLLRPRPPAPFETDISVASIDHPALEQSFEGERHAVEGAVRPASGPDRPMAPQARPVEPEPSTTNVRVEAEPAAQPSQAEVRLLPPVPSETLGPHSMAMIGVTRPEARPHGAEASSIVGREAESTVAASNTKHGQHGILAEPSAPVARRSPAAMPAGSSQETAVPEASEVLPSTSPIAAAPFEGEHAARPIENGRGAVALEIEAPPPRTAAKTRNAPSRTPQNPAVTAGSRPAHGDRIQPAAPPARSAGRSARSAASPAPAPQPAVEIRIGRIDVTVPPAANPTARRPAEVGMSLDAFLAETRQ